MKSKLLERVNYVGQNLWKTRWWNFLFLMDEKVVLTCCVFEGVCPRRWAGELLQRVWCWNPTFRLRRERWQIRRQGHSNTSLWLSNFYLSPHKKTTVCYFSCIALQNDWTCLFFESEPSGIEIFPCLTPILLEKSPDVIKEEWNRYGQLVLNDTAFYWGAWHSLLISGRAPFSDSTPKNRYYSGTDGRWQESRHLCCFSS